MAPTPLGLRAFCKTPSSHQNFLPFSSATSHQIPRFPQPGFLTEPIFKVALKTFAQNRGARSRVQLLSNLRQQLHFPRADDSSQYISTWVYACLSGTRKTSVSSTSSGDQKDSPTAYSPASSPPNSPVLKEDSPPTSPESTTKEPEQHVEFVDWNERRERDINFWPPLRTADAAYKTAPWVDGFDPTTGIEDEAWMLTVRKHIPSLQEETFNPQQFEVENKSSGTFNVVKFVRVTDWPEQGLFVVKVPRVGHPSHWSEPDGLALQSEAETLLLIREKTTCPVPEVMGYDHFPIQSQPGHQNPLGLPYIVMRAVDGISAFDLWNPRHVAHELHLSPEDRKKSEAKRTMFVTSLAKAMSGLATLKFSRIGNVSRDPRSGNYFITNTWVTEWNDGGTRRLIARPTFKKSRDYWMTNLERGLAIPPSNIHDNDDFIMEVGARKLMQDMVTSPAFQPSSTSEEEETHVLAHPDLDLQNILCNPATGAVTAIIDWDACRAVPLPIGYSSLPLFLIRDWHPIDPLEPGRLSPREVVKYCAVYTAAMQDALGADARYTRKSAMYQAVAAALWGNALGGFDKRDLVGRVVRESEALRRVEGDQICRVVGEAVVKGDLKNPFYEEIHREIEGIMSV